MYLAATGIALLPYYLCMHVRIGTVAAALFRIRLHFCIPTEGLGTHGEMLCDSLWPLAE